MPVRKRRIRLPLRRPLQVEHNVELAALALLAADRDVAAHRVHNILGDRHPQPGTLRFLHPGVVLSAEGFKYDLLVLL